MNRSAEEIFESKRDEITGEWKKNLLRRNFVNFSSHIVRVSTVTKS
jgi:hypothetical protein